MNRLPSANVQDGRPLPWLTGLAVAIAAGLWLTQGPVPEALVFDRLAIADGEWWRLFTGHWVHSDGEHAFWDIAALAVAGALVEGGGRWRLALAAVAGGLAVDATIWWWLPELQRYCGLSGLLHALFALALADLWQRTRQPVVLAVGAILAGKLLLELVAGRSLLLDPSWPGVPLAHLAGLAGGLLCIGGRWPWRTPGDRRAPGTGMPQPT